MRLKLATRSTVDIELVQLGIDTPRSLIDVGKKHLRDHIDNAKLVWTEVCQEFSDVLDETYRKASRTSSPPLPNVTGAQAESNLLIGSKSMDLSGNDSREP